MLYKNVVLFMVRFIATRELNIYWRNWAVSKTYVNTGGDYRAYIRSKKRRWNGCVTVTMKEIPSRLEQVWPFQSDIF